MDYSGGCQPTPTQRRRAATMIALLRFKAGIVARPFGVRPSSIIPASFHTLRELLSSFHAKNIVSIYLKVFPMKVRDGLASGAARQPALFAASSGQRQNVTLQAPGLLLSIVFLLRFYQVIPDTFQPQYAPFSAGEYAIGPNRHVGPTPPHRPGIQRERHPRPGGCRLASHGEQHRQTIVW